jgi:seryl-tRNA synthetase
MPEGDTFKILDSITTKKIPQEKYDCLHTRIEIDVEKRMLRCRDCEVYLDPFDYLLRFWNRVFERIVRIGKQKEEELDELLEKVHKLKREKQNLEASVRRLRMRRDTQ